MIPRLLLVVILAGLAACVAPSPERPTLTVGSAASLRPVVEELAQAFEPDVTIVTGASGTLATQVRQGAPIDVFISADARFTTNLANDGFLDQASLAELARGELIAITTLESASADPLSFIAEDRVKHIALANPDLAPYGAATRRYLEGTGVWDRIADKVVYGENVAQALQFVASGNAEVGFVPLSLTLASQSEVLRSLDALPAEASSSLVVTAGAATATEQKDLAERFIGFLKDASSGPVWKRHGYAPLTGAEGHE